jgi:copper chaperone CopZ
MMNEGGGEKCSHTSRLKHHAHSDHHHDPDTHHHHDHHHHHDDHQDGPASKCHVSTTTDDDISPPWVDTDHLCLALVRENGIDVVVFDASGVPKTFRSTNSNSFLRTKSHLPPPKLCFDSHGHYDELLTPCFDGEGMHGSPEDSCFCGVETPHLHAHLHDPQTCQGDQPNRKTFPSDRIGMLASQTLVPSASAVSELLHGSHPLVHIPITDSLPKQCNAHDVAKATGPTESSKLQLRHGSRRIRQVQHEDHVDYLVHNASTNQLHLEHPCDECGMKDVHGKFHAMGQRRLKSVQLHFFGISPRPFSLMECLADLFEPHSDCVAVVENIVHSGGVDATGGRCANATNKSFAKTKMENHDTTTTVVRSTFNCTQICCSSEVPVIRTVLKPIQGIIHVRVNVPLKQVLVDHDCHIVSATEIQQALHQFGGTIIRDGGVVQMVSTGMDIMGRSQFHVSNICCASEIPAILRIVQPLHGVKTVSVNTTSKIVYVEHEVDTVTATAICSALTADGFDAQIRVDASLLQAATAMSSSSLLVTSTLQLSRTPSDLETKNLTTFLQNRIDASQLESFQVENDGGTITVVHNPFCWTIQKIAQEISEELPVEISVAQDGADPALWKLMDDSLPHQDTLDRVEKSVYPKLHVIVSGILWVISMLSLVGGNWYDCC